MIKYAIRVVNTVTSSSTVRMFVKSFQRNRSFCVEEGQQGKVEYTV